MTAAVYETIKRYAAREAIVPGMTIPVVVDEERPEGLPLLANHEVRLCMADFVDLRRLAVKDELGLALE